VVVYATNGRTIGVADASVVHTITFSTQI
jgi:hypothetical protein